MSFLVIQGTPLVYLGTANRSYEEITRRLTEDELRDANENRYPLTPGVRVELVVLRLDPQHREIEAQLLFDPTPLLERIARAERIDEPLEFHVEAWDFEFYSPSGLAEANQEGSATPRGSTAITKPDPERWLLESTPFRLTPSAANPSRYPFDSYVFRLAGFVTGKLRLPNADPRWPTSYHSEWISEIRVRAYDSSARLEPLPPGTLERVNMPGSFGNPLGSVGVGSFKIVRPRGLRAFGLYLLVLSIAGIVAVTTLAIRGDLRTQLAAFFGFAVLLIQLRPVLLRGTDYFPTLVDYFVFLAFGLVVMTLGVGWVWRRQHAHDEPRPAA